MTFGFEERFQICRRYGWDFLSYYIYQIVGLYIPQRTVVRSLIRIFGFDLNENNNKLKAKAAEYYSETKTKILKRIIQGKLVHVDETRANIAGRSAFVWVLTNMHEVVYILTDSREGEAIQKLLAEFKGVLISDFYSTYDKIGGAQQRWLIHLIRDLNDEMLNNPFDEEFKQIVVAFGNLMRSIVETVDLHGLKCHFLKKHLISVERFYRYLMEFEFHSEPAVRCKERFEKNRNRLFTFLSHDGVPWNNNNAEHAIKAFARLREILGGVSTEKGLQEYLILLSISQTCEYSGIDFLDFLRSGEKDIHAFAENKRRRTNEQYNISLGQQ